MKLIIGNWCFNPKIVTSLFALMFFCLFVFLGFWQLDRAEYKRNLYADFKNRQSLAVINFNLKKNNKRDKRALLWRKVEAKGKFLEQFQILLDNQVEDTQAGYFIYTPFKLDKNDRVVLVNKGWLLADADRSVIPKLTFTNGLVKIKGVVKDIPKTGLLLKEMPPEKMAKNFFRVQRINIEEIGQLTKEKLLPYIIRLEPESAHGYKRKWRLPALSENMHLGYAFQWFAFATALLIIYLVLNIKKIEQTHE